MVAGINGASSPKNLKKTTNIAWNKDATTDFGTGVEAINRRTKGKTMNKSTQETLDWAEKEGW